MKMTPYHTVQRPAPPRRQPNDELQPWLVPHHHQRWPSGGEYGRIHETSGVVVVVVVVVEEEEASLTKKTVKGGQHVDPTRCVLGQLLARGGGGRAQAGRHWACQGTVMEGTWVGRGCARTIR